MQGGRACLPRRGEDSSCTPSFCGVTVGLPPFYEVLSVLGVSCALAFAIALASRRRRARTKY